MEWAPEFDVDESLALQLITRQFPQVRAASIARFGAGMDNVAYLVDDRYVFRFPRRAIVAPLLERETRVLGRIAPLVPVAIPVPQFIGKPDEGYPWTFAGYDRLQGVTACTTALSRLQRFDLAAPLGGFLRALHAADPQIGAGAGLPGDELGRLDHDKRFPLAKQRFAELEAASVLRDTEPFLSFLAAHAPRPARAPCSIVHGDLYARHVLLDTSQRLCGIIDWGDVHLGDRAVDLMVAHSMLPQRAHGEFMRAYGAVDEETWLRAKYRAVYHCALVAHFGMQINDAGLRDAGLTGLRFIREAL
jgi:aminoglycoside phosphotransferase (APT) family kinase protein